MSLVYQGDSTWQGYRCARKLYYCIDCERQTIKPGDRYLYCVAMPGADVHSGKHPWVLRICTKCKPEQSPPPSQSDQ